MNEGHSPLLVLATARPDGARSQITLGRLVVIVIIIIIIIIIAISVII